MKIRQLAYFVAIVDHGCLSRAAVVLHVAQPADPAATPAGGRIGCEAAAPLGPGRARAAEARHKLGTKLSTTMAKYDLLWSAFKLLAKMKGLRGGACDIFGYNEERRMERALVNGYHEMITGLVCAVDRESCSGRRTGEPAGTDPRVWPRESAQRVAFSSSKGPAAGACCNRASSLRRS